MNGWRELTQGRAICNPGGGGERGRPQRGRKCPAAAAAASTRSRLAGSA